MQEKENEALLDRMVIIKIPSPTRTRRASTRSSSPAPPLQDVHMDPHVLKLAAVFAILTRLQKSSARGWTSVRSAADAGEAVEGVSETR